MSHIKDFFDSLSVRMYKENDLSDITWALCIASPMFREFFLRFFFPDIKIDPNVEIEREVSKEDSRPDFIIHNYGVLYLVENKINDENHHFGQYDNAFNITPKRFGYIANYTIPQPDQEKHYQIKTWEDFYYSSANILCAEEEEQTLIDSYRVYLKNVCNIIEFTKPMNLEGIYSLYQFMEILTRLCKREEERYTISVYTQDRTFDNGHARHHSIGNVFELNYKDFPITRSWGWIGIYYEMEMPEIWIAFLDIENWGKPICELIRRNEGKFANLKLSQSPVFEDDTYWFRFTPKKEGKEISFSALDLEEQTKMLKSFMDEILTAFM